MAVSYRSMFEPLKRGIDSKKKSSKPKIIFIGGAPVSEENLRELIKRKRSENPQDDFLFMDINDIGVSSDENSVLSETMKVKRELLDYALKKGKSVIVYNPSLSAMDSIVDDFKSQGQEIREHCRKYSIDFSMIASPTMESLLTMLEQRLDRLESGRDYEALRDVNEQAVEQAAESSVFAVTQCLRAVDKINGSTNRPHCSYKVYGTNNEICLDDDGKLATGFISPDTEYCRACIMQQRNSNAEAIQERCKRLYSNSDKLRLRLPIFDRNTLDLLAERIPDRDLPKEAVRRKSLMNRPITHLPNGLRFIAGKIINRHSGEAIDPVTGKVCDIYTGDVVREASKAEKEFFDGKNPKIRVYRGRALGMLSAQGLFDGSSKHDNLPTATAYEDDVRVVPESRNEPYPQFSLADDALLAGRPPEEVEELRKIDEDFTR